MAVGGDVVLRCRACRDHVTVGSGDSETWRLPLWDHLLDQHMDMVVLGRQAEIEFTAPGGIFTRVTQQQGWDGR